MKLFIRAGLSTAVLAAAATVALAQPATPAPIASPDGLREVWAPAGCHCVWGIERGATPKKLFDIRGQVGKIVFSPDGTRIAFENPRGDWTVEAPGSNPAVVGLYPAKYYGWGFIAVYDFANNRLSYVDPSFATDTGPTWSDNASVSFTRHAEGAPDAQLTRPASPAPVTMDPFAHGTSASYLRSPLVYQPIVAAHSGVGAFTFREGEYRGIFVFGPGTAWLPYVMSDKDDGQALSDIRLTSTGDLIAYVRGARPNKMGEVPNPRAEAKKPIREIWIGGTAPGQTPHLIGEGEAPLFTPDGQRLVFASDRGLMIAPLFRDGAGGVRLGEASEFVPGDAGDAKFSPDGSKLLFARGPRLFVYDLGNDRTTPIDHPKGSVDEAPIWSPDGTKVVFIRSNQAPTPGYNLGYDGPFVTEKSWSLAFYDVGAKSVRELWRANPGVGSTYYPLDEDATETGNRGEQLYWSADNRIVFAWEGEGWRHLYSVSVAGGDAKLLTPGDGEIESVAQTVDRKRLIVATNIGDLGRRHLSSIDVANATLTPLTTGKSDEWGPAAMSDGSLAYVASSWNYPPTVAVRHADGQVDYHEAIPEKPVPGRPQTAWVEPRLIEFKASDGWTAYGQLFVPAHPNGCGVVFAHGGIKRQMLPGFHYMDAYSVLYETNQYLASKGCVVLSVEYRSSIMRGYAFRNAPGWGSAGASEMLDVAAAGTYLKTHPDLKVRHVGIYGLSWGGYITSQALARYPDIFEAGFDMAGVHEFFGDRVGNSAEAKIADWRAPVYLVQGDDDRNVDFWQGLSLAAMLRKQGVDATFRVIPDEVHDMTSTFANTVAVYGSGADFLYDHLTKPAKPGPKRK